MADILVTALETSHGSTTGAITKLQSLGHTTTLIAESALTVSTAQNYDLVYCSRAGVASGVVDTKLDVIQAGIPLIETVYGGIFPGTVSGATVLGSLGLCTSVYLTEQQKPTYYRRGQDAFFGGYLGNSPAQTDYTLTDSAVFTAAGIGTTEEYLYLEAADGKAPFIMANKGAEVGGRVLGAGYALLGFTYYANALATDGDIILASVIEYLVEGVKELSGTVKVLGVPAQREVVAIRESNNRTSGATTSSPDGTYKLVVPATGAYTVFCRGEGDEEAQIFQGVS